MELTKQVTSLEISKRLKELGVKQDSLFAWLPMTDTEDYGLFYEWHLSKNEPIFAFTVAEIGEMLGKCHFKSSLMEIQFGVFHVGTFTNIYCTTKRDSHMDMHIESDTEADARGKMLIYLLENKHIELK